MRTRRNRCIARLRLIERQGTHYFRYGIFVNGGRKPARTFEVFPGFPDPASYQVAEWGHGVNAGTKAAATRYLKRIARQVCK